MALALPVGAQEPDFVVVVIGDGPSDRLASQQDLYIEELLALAGSEFDVEIRRIDGNWSRESTERVLDRAYSDPTVDMVLVVGFVANQVAATREEYPKPTFLPLILDTGLLVSDEVNGTSGIPNLNYLNAYANFADDLDTFSRFLDYRNLVLIVDAALSSSIPELRDAAYQASEARGINLIEVVHDGIDHKLMNRVPAETDAIFIAGLPRMPTPEFEALIDAINDAKLPSYSFAGVADVERGLLVTDREPRDFDRQARLNALNMQAVMIGGRAEEQPIASLHKEQLTINMATARKIGLSPSFEVIKNAVLLNRVEVVSGKQIGLVEIARLAMERNPELIAEGFGIEAGVQSIARARANLLPQLDVSASQTLRRDSPSVSAGLFAERSLDSALNVNQLLYSDSARANLEIQKSLQQARLASLRQFRLDVVLAATSAYYAVLNAHSQLEVQENNLRTIQANLELAKERVRLGSSTAADVYRWEAEVAQSMIVVLNARSAENQAWDALNRVLQRPQGERFALREASFDEPFVMTRREFDQLIASPADYARFSRFYVDRALRQSPELQQLDAQIVAKKRELTSQRRAYWLPDFSIGGRYTNNLGQSGVGAGPQAGEDLNDWSIGIQATLPIFSGGQKRANVSKVEYELRQLMSLYTATRDRVEEQIRRQLYAAQAAYVQIDLSATAAEASRKNLELVSDAYAQGTVTVIELLDAQNASLSASAASAESLYSFLTVIMSLQRAVGGYDYLLDAEGRDALAREFRLYLTGSSE